MTIEEAIKEIKDASYSEARYGDKDNHHDEVIKRIDAFDMAIKALNQLERIAKLVNELHLEDVSPKDFDNMFYLQSVKEVKEEMWRMYCFAEDVVYTLDL